MVIDPLVVDVIPGVVTVPVVTDFVVVDPAVVVTLGDIDVDVDITPVVAVELIVVVSL